MIPFVAMAGLIAAGCAPRAPFAFPAGTPTPSAEAAAIWQTATAACRSVATYSAEIVINGRVGTEKLRRVTLQGAMTRDGRIRLLAVAPVGAPIFVLAGATDRATLTLPHDHRTLTAPVADIVDALIGLRFAPADWVDVLTGCVAGTGGAGDAAAGGYIGRDLVMSLDPSSRALLRNSGTTWRVVAGERAGATIEYGSYLGTWPSAARITSGANAAVPLSLNLDVAQIFANVPAPDKTFVVDVPRDFAPMTLAELRAIGPLGDKGGRP